MKTLSLCLCFATLRYAVSVNPDPTPSFAVSNSLYQASSDVMMMMSPGLTEPTDDETTTSFLDEHLSLIIGVPTGIGLCILMFVGCLIYCGISALYHSWKEKKLQSNSVSGTGTKTTGIPLATPHSSTADYNSSSYHASYFEPSEDTLPQRHNKDKSNQQEAIDHAFEPSEDTLPRRHNKEKQQAIDVEQTSTF